MTAKPDPADTARRVLVVDDEPVIRELLSMICTYEGWDARAADAGESALRIAQAWPPDLVLLDLMLPDVDGLTVLRRLRAQSPRLPVIVLTARDSAADRTTALAAGADGYVTKPFGVAALAEQIRRLLTGDPASASVTTTRG